MELATAERQIKELKYDNMWLEDNLSRMSASEIRFSDATRALLFRIEFIRVTMADDLSALNLIREELDNLQTAWEESGV